MLLAVVVLFAVSFLLQNTSYVLDQYGSWIANLLSDRRRELDYYGKNRDFYLLLRLAGIPITTSWWMVLQLLTALCAAAVCLASKRRLLPPTSLLFGVMCLSISWMLLFGPATEAATYVLIATPAAYLVLGGWSHAAPRAVRLWSTIAYVGFIGAEIVNSWFRIKRHVYLVHGIQPLVALCFCIALFFWWQQQYRSATSDGPAQASA